MRVSDFLKNTFLYENKYKTHSEAVIIACYFNPTGNPYRLIAFNTWYNSIKHLNHRIVECVIGACLPELPENENISRVYTKDLLWHKETLLNNLVKTLPSKFKYIFWLDTDLIFTNLNWLTDGVKQLQKANIIQPFEYCVHLEKDAISPDFDVETEKKYVSDTTRRHPRIWRSFCANFVTTNYTYDCNYDKHGHVGFAWGAKRSILDSVPLYDRALIGGADHIIAHAAAGQIGHSCITKSFTEDIEAVNFWSEEFNWVVDEKIGYVKGEVYHIWHGDLDKRQYLKRIQDFTPKSKEITKKDKNGLYVAEDDNTYVEKYFEHRENTGCTHNYPKVDLSYTKLYPEAQRKINIVPERADIIAKRKEIREQYPHENDNFIESMLLGYLSNDGFIGGVVGGNILGGMLGDALNNSEDITTSTEQGFNDGFGGGDFSGGGAGGDFSNDNNNYDSGNFS